MRQLRRLLKKNEQGASCPACETEYQYKDSGALDLRLQSAKQYTLEFEINNAPLPVDNFDCSPLTMCATPEVDFSAIHVPNHLSKEILSYFPKASSPNSLALDLGCGNAAHKAVCEQAGFEWVGLDYNSQKAPILGDAHALPFAAESFDFVLSIAVLEHIRYPFVMAHEAFRVLKPNGKFIGSVAFLEPFHG